MITEFSIFFSVLSKFQVFYSDQKFVEAVFFENRDWELVSLEGGSSEHVRGNIQFKITLRRK